MRESQLVNDLIRGLRPTLKLYRTNAGTFRSIDGKHIVRGLPKGFPDLFGVIPRALTYDGRPMPVYLEAKVHPNKPTPEQIDFLKDAQRAGCIAGVVYSVEEAWNLILPALKR